MSLIEMTYGEQDADDMTRIETAHRRRVERMERERERYVMASPPLPTLAHRPASSPSTRSATANNPDAESAPDRRLQELQLIPRHLLTGLLNTIADTDAILERTEEQLPAIMTPADIRALRERPNELVRRVRQEVQEAGVRPSSESHAEVNARLLQPAPGSDATSRMRENQRIDASNRTRVFLADHEAENTHRVSRLPSYHSMTEEEQRVVLDAIESRQVPPLEAQDLILDRPGLLPSLRNLPMTPTAPAPAGSSTHSTLDHLRAQLNHLHRIYENLTSTLTSIETTFSRLENARSHMRTTQLEFLRLLSAMDTALDDEISYGGRAVRPPHQPILTTSYYNPAARTRRHRPRPNTATDAYQGNSDLTTRGRLVMSRIRANEAAAAAGRVMTPTPTASEPEPRPWPLRTIQPLQRQRRLSAPEVQMTIDNIDASLRNYTASFGDEQMVSAEPVEIESPRQVASVNERVGLEDRREREIVTADVVDSSVRSYAVAFGEEGMAGARPIERRRMEEAVEEVRRRRREFRERRREMEVEEGRREEEEAREVD